MYLSYLYIRTACVCTYIYIYMHQYVPGMYVSKSLDVAVVFTFCMYVCMWMVWLLEALRIDCQTWVKWKNIAYQVYIRFNIFTQ